MKDTYRHDMITITYNIKNMRNSTGKLVAALLTILALCGCSKSEDADFLEVDLKATSPRSSEYFDFGTGDFDLKVDNKGLLMRQADGSMKAMLPVMGEIHPARVNENDWDRELQKMKDGGINTIACYVFWAHQEPQNGKFNWSGNCNIRKFVQLCGSKNLYVVLRIGPFCHGECYLGGIPDWVIADPSIKVRSLDPKFLKYVDRLYRQIGIQCEGLFGSTPDAPIIGVQIENECGGDVWPYMMALKQLALKAGIRPPFFTRTGWPAIQNASFGEMLPLYGDYADGFWDRELTDMPGGYPDAFAFRESRLSNVIATEVFGKNQSRVMEAGDLTYPYFTCELGGGMTPSYARRIHIFDHDAVALSVCKVGSGSNLPGYYMYHGGTNPYNPRHSMGETTDSPFTNWNDLPYMSYDFQAPVGEMGQINHSYYELRRLHSFLSNWGEELSDLDAVFPSTNIEDGRKDSILRYTVRTDGMKGFVFVNNYTRLMPMTDKQGVQWKLNRTDGSSLVFPKRPVTIMDSVVCWFPFGIQCSGLTLDYATAMPYDIAGDEYLFAAVPGVPVELSINGNVYELKETDLLKVRNKEGREITFKVLSDDESLAPIPGYVLHEVQAAGAQATLVNDTKGLREVKFVPQGIVAQPGNEDFDKAACWSIQLDNISDPQTAVLEINYRGDVARLYANGRLVQDNFWNGRPMLVRLRDIVGKKVQLKILPLGKDYSIYLQPDQRKVLAEADGDYLLSLDSLRILDF